MKNAWALFFLMFSLYIGGSRTKECNAACTCADSDHLIMPRSYNYYEWGDTIDIICDSYDTNHNNCEFSNHVISKEIIENCPLVSLPLANWTHFVLKVKGNTNVTLRNDVFEDFNDLQYLELRTARSGTQWHPNATTTYVQLPEDLFSHIPNVVNLKIMGDTEGALVENNWLTRAPPKVSKNLEAVTLIRVNLPTLNESNFQGFAKLESLRLSSNEMKDIPKDAFSKLTQLRSLDLSMNYLQYNSDDIKSLFYDHGHSNLPQKLQLIDLRGNLFSALPKHFFQNLTQLQSLLLGNNRFKILPLLPSSLVFLDLSNNNLTILDVHSFRGHTNLELVHLKQLDLSYNILNFTEQSQYFPFSNLSEMRQLNISFNQLAGLHKNFFQNSFSLKVIDLSHNRLTFLDTTVFKELIHLELLVLSHNLIHQMANDEPIGLKTIDLSHNKITEIEIFDLPSVKKVDLSFNSISKVTYMKLETIHRKNFSESFRFASPTVVHLENNTFTTIEIGYDELNFLAHLDEPKITDPPYKISVSDNQLDCTDCRISTPWIGFNKPVFTWRKSYFQILPNDLLCANPPNTTINDVPISAARCPLDALHHNFTACPEKCQCYVNAPVLFDYNLIIDCSVKNLDRFPEIISLVKFFKRIYSGWSWSSHIELHLEQNNLKTGPTRNLSGYDKITKLFLSHNHIDMISWLPPKLQILSLDNNHLKSLNYEILRTLNKTYLSSLTLHDNPWTCDCQSENLTNFLRHHPATTNIRNIYCFNSTRPLVFLNKNDLCYERHSYYTIVVVLSVLIIIVITAVFALFLRFQQELKIWLFAKHWCLCWITEKEIDKDKLYDAFISFSHKDQDFVSDELLPVLESGPDPYKLCVFYRDWFPGELIKKLIRKSVLDSKRTIIVLSKNFLESEWSKTEFRAAHTKAMTDGTVRLIIILLEHVADELMEPALREYLKTYTYIEWGDPYFWDKLRYALPHFRINESTRKKLDPYNFASVFDMKRREHMRNKNTATDETRTAETSF